MRKKARVFGHIKQPKKVGKMIYKDFIMIGEFQIRRYDDNSFWISTKDGAGGQFREDELEKIIEKFYIENF